MRNTFFAFIGIVALVVFLLIVGVQGQREAAAPPAAPARAVEYLVVPAAEIGIDLNDILLGVDYELVTDILNAYAADGWRVHAFDMFGRPAVLLERDIILLPEGAE